MKKVFKIFKLVEKEVHVDSTSYYVNGPENATIYTTEPIHLKNGNEFFNKKDAESELDSLSNNKFNKGEYIIKEVYIIK